MEVADTFVFQADAEIVRGCYLNNPNYIIEYNNENPKDYCILYFSSHNIYNPNTESEFKKNILKKDRYEWYGTRINYGHKHIFIRDIIKQWYLTGINGNLDQPSRLLDFLKKETEGYRIITLGSSAGGFAAVIYGQLLNAETILSFNGQFQVNSLIDISTPGTDPVIFRSKNNPVIREFYDCRNFISNPSSVYYFYSNSSDWDVEQREHIEGISINIIEFKTSHHGIPFLKSNLPALLNSRPGFLNSLSGKIYHPVFFSFKMIGFFSTVKSIFQTGVQVIKQKLRKV